MRTRAGLDGVFVCFTSVYCGILNGDDLVSCFDSWYIFYTFLGRQLANYTHLSTLHSLKHQFLTGTWDTRSSNIDIRIPFRCISRHFHVIVED
jgi:hypothetical protein